MLGNNSKILKELRNRIIVVENRPFYTFGLTAIASDRRLSTASNVGFVKQKA